MGKKQKPSSPLDHALEEVRKHGLRQKAAQKAGRKTAKNKKKSRPSSKSSA